MARLAHLIVAASLAAALAACHSPIAEWEESGPPEDPQKVGVGVHGWPFYERDPNRDGVRTDVLWPLTSVRMSHEGELRRAHVLFPVVLVEKDGTRRRFGLRPLFDVESDSKEGAEVSDVDLLFPIVKWRAAPDERRFDVRPLWWSGRSGDDTAWTVLFPVGGHWRRPTGDGWFAGPFAGGWTKADETGNWYALGLVGHETSDDGGGWHVFPLAAGSHDESGDTADWHVVWPGLAGHRRDGDVSHDWAVPFWYRHADADSTTSVVVPVWFSHADADGATRILFPFYGATHETDLDRTYWGGNLLVLTDRPDGGGFDVLWPIVHYDRDGEGWNARVAPILWLERKGDAGHTHVWPLFGRSWDGDRRGWSVAAPLAGYRSSPDEWKAHLFPVLWFKRSASEEWTHVWPLFGTSRHDEVRERSVAWPFLRWTTAPDGWEAHLPFPFVEIDRRGDEHATRAVVARHASNPSKGSYEGDVLWLVSNWEADGEGRSDFRILWRLVQSTDSGDRRVLAVNPLFRHESNDRGDRHWSALFGLVARTREAEDVRWRLLWFLTM